MSKFVYPFFVLIICIFVVACTEKPYAGGTSVQGNGLEFSVIDSSGNLITGAHVRIRNKSFLANNQDTRFAFDSLLGMDTIIRIDSIPAGEYYVEIISQDKGALASVSFLGNRGHLELGNIVLQNMAILSGQFDMPAINQNEEYMVLVQGLDKRVELDENGYFSVQLVPGTFIVELWRFNSDGADSSMYAKSVQLKASDSLNWELITSTDLDQGLIGIWNLTGQESGFINPDSQEYNFGSSSFAISAWFRSDTIRNINLSERIVAKEADGFGHWSLSLYYPGSIIFRVRENNASAERIDLFAEDSLLDNLWHHIIAMRIDDSLSLYIDGEFVASKFIGTINLDSDLPLGIGTNAIDDSHAFSGEIGAIRLYSKPLNRLAIDSLFSLGP